MNKPYEFKMCYFLPPDPITGKTRYTYGDPYFYSMVLNELVDRDKLLNDIINYNIEQNINSNIDKEE